MKAISFAWTLPDLLAGRKGATRRFWVDRHARSFREGELVTALSKDRRAGGKPVAIIKLTCDPFKQTLAKMTDADLVKEGTLWDSVEEFREMMLGQGKGDEPWVLEFKLIGTSIDLWPEGHTNPSPKEPADG